jgi:WD40 repeat protein
MASALEAAAAAAASVEPTALNLEAVIGFNGSVPNGLVAHPDGVHIIFPLGSTVVIKNTVKNTQSFLQGHTASVTTLALSPDGAFLASGQETNLGFKVSKTEHFPCVPCKVGR